jgi:hypothetical protein
VWDSLHPHRLGERPSDVYDLLGHRLLLAQVKDARKAAGLPRRLAAHAPRPGRGPG